MKPTLLPWVPGRASLAIAVLLAMSGCGDPNAQSDAFKAYRAQVEADCMSPDESIPDIPFFHCRYSTDFNKSLAAYLKRTRRSVQSITASTPDYENTYIVILK